MTVLSACFAAAHCWRAWRAKSRCRGRRASIGRFAARNHQGYMSSRRSSQAAYEPPCGWKISKCQPMPVSWMTSGRRPRSSSAASCEKARRDFVRAIRCREICARQRFIAEALGDDVQIVTAAGGGAHELPTPFAHAAAAAVEVVDDNGDSHHIRPLASTTGGRSESCCAAQIATAASETVFGPFPICSAA